LSRQIAKKNHKGPSTKKTVPRNARKKPTGKPQKATKNKPTRESPKDQKENPTRESPNEPPGKNGWSSWVLAHHLPSVTTQAGRMGGKPATLAQHNVEQTKTTGNTKGLPRSHQLNHHKDNQEATTTKTTKRATRKPPKKPNDCQGSNQGTTKENQQRRPMETPRDPQSTTK
jgi:hypothetical protein